MTREPSAVLHVAFLKSKDVIASRPEAFAGVAPDVGALLQARVVGGGFDAEDGPSLVLLALDDAVLDELAETYAGRAKVVKVNVDDHKQYAAKYNVCSIPMLLVFKGGDVAGQQIGAAPRQRRRVLRQRPAPLQQQRDPGRIAQHPPQPVADRQPAARRHL